MSRPDLSKQFEALKLLQQQQLLPFIIVHEHRFGHSTFVMWAETQPSEEEVLAYFPNLDFEPEREEFININETTLMELLGLNEE